MARDVESLLRQQAALATFGSFAFQETDLMAILSEAARICAESLNVRHCKVCRYREAENDLLVEAGLGWKEGVVGHVVSRADESSPQGRAFVTGQPVIIHNLHETNGYTPPPFYAQHGIISTVDVLIKARNGPPFGVLEVDSTEQHNYDEHDIDFLTGFANILAEAVATKGRSRLLQENLDSIEALVIEKDRLLEQRDVLAQELQHRVRNNLHLVNAMLNDLLKQSTDESARRGLRGIIRRVMSLGQVYDHLLGVGLTRRLDFGVYAKLLCANLPDLQPAPAAAVTLVCHAEEVILDLTAVTALGLVIAELVSNSYEHAFASQPGTIEVTVKQDGTSGRGIVTIRDDGVGYLPAAESKRRGIGLTRRLMEQIGGTLEVDGSPGTTWTLRFPVASVTGAAAA
jgi:two-component sensor histidine kinase